MKFCGMQLEDSVPSYSVLSRFRTELTEKKAFDLLLSQINHQLEKHRIIIHQGVKVDASITQSSFHSKKPKTFEIKTERKTNCPRKKCKNKVVSSRKWLKMA